MFDVFLNSNVPNVESGIDLFCRYQQDCRLTVHSQGRLMIITLKVTLVRGLYAKHAWSAEIELDDSSTLDVLHDTIQDAVSFDNDHLYCFFRSRTEHSRTRELFDDENGLIWETKLSDMFPLPPKQALFYLFDWATNGSSKSPPAERSHTRPRRA